MCRVHFDPSVTALPGHEDKTVMSGAPVLSSYQVQSLNFKHSVFIFLASHHFDRKDAWSLFSRCMMMKTCPSCTAHGTGSAPHLRTSEITMGRALLFTGLLPRHTQSSLPSSPFWALQSSSASIMESTTLAATSSSPSSTCSALRSSLRCGRERPTGTVSTGAHLGNSGANLPGLLNQGCLS